MTDEATTKRRALLRDVFDNLFDLEMTVRGETIKGIGVERAREVLKDAFDGDIERDCEDCGKVNILGELGHRTADDCTLCAECSPTWADCKSQWDEGREEDEPGDKAKFLAGYDAHIAAGGSPDDKLVYEL